MKKLIDIPESILQDLQILAVKGKKPLKNYIESQLVLLVGREKLKKNENEKSKNN